MKVLKIHDAVSPTKLHGQDAERVMDLTGELFRQILQGTSGPVEALASIGLLANMLTQVFESNGFSREDIKALIEQAEAFEQTMRPVILTIPMDGIGISAGTPAGSAPS